MRSMHKVVKRENITNIISAKQEKSKSQAMQGRKADASKGSLKTLIDPSNNKAGEITVVHHLITAAIREETKQTLLRRFST